jgi:hypothetical protein
MKEHVTYFGGGEGRRGGQGENVGVGAIEIDTLE